MYTNSSGSYSCYWTKFEVLLIKIWNLTVPNRPKSSNLRITQFHSLRTPSTQKSPISDVFRNITLFECERNTKAADGAEMPRLFSHEKRRKPGGWLSYYITKKRRNVIRRGRDIKDIDHNPTKLKDPFLLGENRHRDAFVPPVTTKVCNFVISPVEEVCGKKRIAVTSRGFFIKI